MTRVSLFNSPLLLGFDHFERMLDTMAKTSPDGYPPYNVEQLGEDALRITLAVAGFSQADLSVGLEGNQLIVRGKQPEEPGNRIFLHRGIAARQFQRRFLLAEGIEVVAASIEDGLLHVDLRRPQPVERSRKIEIKARPTKSRQEAIEVEAATVGE
jgi:HSP20 family molecular chaperone IbpA